MRMDGKEEEPVLVKFADGAFGIRRPDNFVGWTFWDITYRDWATLKGFKGEIYLTEARARAELAKLLEQQRREQDYGEIVVE